MLKEGAHPGSGSVAALTAVRSHRPMIEAPPLPDAPPATLSPEVAASIAALAMEFASQAESPPQASMWKHPLNPVLLISGDIDQAMAVNLIRDSLGLHYFRLEELLVVVPYDSSIPLEEDSSLQAPVNLDSLPSKAGSEFWVFVKRSDAGGPDWGRAADLANHTPGMKEALHWPFPVHRERSRTMNGRVTGDSIIHSPWCNHAQLVTVIPWS